MFRLGLSSETDEAHKKRIKEFGEQQRQLAFGKEGK